MHGYWERTLKSRVSRRRALTAAAGTSAAALFLAACGGDDEEPASSGSGSGSGSPSTGSGSPSTGSGSPSGLVTAPVDTTSSAKKGGTFKYYTRAEPQNLDGHFSQAALNQMNGLAYSSLVSNKPGHLMPSSFTEVVPNLATGYEFSGDGLTLTFKLREGVKFHNKAPVNGRVFDSEDVIATWEKFIEVGANAFAHANSLNPNAPILSVDAPDKQTVVYTLKEPASYILQRFARLISGEVGTIQPKEIKSGFDPAIDQIGTGGWVLDSWEPNVQFTYSRNMEYWDANEPYIDRIEMPVVPDAATQLAQFKAGNIYALSVQQTDVLATKEEQPDMLMYTDAFVFNNPGAMIGFGWLPWGNYDSSPFLDERVRQAVSLCIDRELWMDAMFLLSEREAAGLPTDTQYFSSMGYVPGVTLDPRDSSFGENAKWYQYNGDEARKLLMAAYPDGVELDAKFVGSGRLVAPLEQLESIDGMASAVGFKINRVQFDDETAWNSMFTRGLGQFDGWAWRSGPVASPDPLDFYIAYYQTGGSTGGLGFSANGTNDQAGDPEVNALIDKAKGEFDAPARVAILQDLQRYLGKRQYAVSRPGQTDILELVWPALQNFQVFQDDSRGGTGLVHNGFYNWWIDETKAPIA
jgi:peptide/nickel transport system substrate-binding protein